MAVSVFQSNPSRKLNPSLCTTLLPAPTTILSSRLLLLFRTVLQKLQRANQSASSKVSSALTHLTITTNSSSLYTYVEPFIKPLNTARPIDVFDKVKVFVNGCWVGVTDYPMELYTDMKNKKYRGIINVYTSVVFDYKMMEIRICNDSGRMTRPLLRVTDGKALISQEIINRLESGELAWNDLLTNCKLDTSVIEYIDPDEQNFAMIALKTKDSYVLNDTKIEYTHCEIHPSTILESSRHAFLIPSTTRPRETLISALKENRPWAFMRPTTTNVSIKPPTC